MSEQPIPNRTTQNNEQKEKTGGAVPGWLSGAAKVGTGQGALGGIAGAGFGAKGLLGAKLAGLMSSKAVVAGIIAVGLTVGGLVSYNEVQKVKRAETAAQFSDAMMGPRRDSRGAAVAGRPSAGVSALALAQRANRGIYGPSDEAADADADAAASADGDIPEADGEGDALGQSDSQAAAAEMAEAMGEEQASKAAKEGLGTLFGKMSAGTGGGKRMQLAGGAGMSGGIGAKFKQKPLSNQRLKAMSKGRKAGVSRSKTAARGRKGSKLKGANARRLDKMNRAMGTTGRGPATETAAVHTAQWDGAQPGGQALDGAGAGGIGASDSTFEGGEGIGIGEPITPTSYSWEKRESWEEKIEGKNVTPYQDILGMIIAATVVAWTLLFIAGIMADTKWGEGFAAIAAGAAVLIGVMAIVAALSIGREYGQAAQSDLLVFNGATLVATGAIALSGGETAVKIQKYIKWIALVGMAVSIGNFLQ